jgi:hypothetical protein
MSGDRKLLPYGRQLIDENQVAGRCGVIFSLPYRPRVEEFERVLSGDRNARRVVAVRKYSSDLGPSDTAMRAWPARRSNLRM